MISKRINGGDLNLEGISRRDFCRREGNDHGCVMWQDLYSGDIPCPRAKSVIIRIDGNEDLGVPFGISIDLRAAGTIAIHDVDPLARDQSSPPDLKSRCRSPWFEGYAPFARMHSRETGVVLGFRLRGTPIPERFWFDEYPAAFLDAVFADFVDEFEAMAGCGE